MSAGDTIGLGFENWLTSFPTLMLVIFSVDLNTVPYDYEDERIEKTNSFLIGNNGGGVNVINIWFSYWNIKKFNGLK